RTRITEQVQLEFRATFLNAFNHANFTFGDATQSAAAAAAQTTFDSTTFGRITSTTANGTPRNIFFALGLNF
ncbi:MAG: hypothetical protein J2P31_06650, partial [Blastocatellia bacterium]|nr:hypothetical protein [Blastocatellia bacterium]